ncbi:Uncharacterised protein [Mycobacteroides abscessus subsp. abscessus]|nr:Uncharacterised protein [Mycobacteroides abscessus subsp. abscessus]
MAPEIVVDHPFPRIQLEDRFDGRLFQIHQSVEVMVPADLLNRQTHGVDAGLGRALLQIGQGHMVFASLISRRPGEMRFRPRQLATDMLPARHELLMQ